MLASSLWKRPVFVRRVPEGLVVIAILHCKAPLLIFTFLLSPLWVQKPCFAFCRKGVSDSVLLVGIQSIPSFSARVSEPSWRASVCLFLAPPWQAHRFICFAMDPLGANTKGFGSVVQAWALSPSSTRGECPHTPPAPPWSTMLPGTSLTLLSPGKYTYSSAAGLAQVTIADLHGGNGEENFLSFFCIWKGVWIHF